MVCSYRSIRRKPLWRPIFCCNYSLLNDTWTRKCDRPSRKRDVPVADTVLVLDNDIRRRQGD